MRARRISFGLTVLALWACGGGGGDDGGGGPTPPPPPQNQTLGSITTNVTTLAMTAGELSTIAVTAYDTENRVITGVSAPTFASQNASVAEVASNGRVLAIGAGSTQIDVSLTHSGVTRTAQIPVTVSGQLAAGAAVVASSIDYIFTPRDVVIKTGGTVDWTFGSLEHTVTFSPAAGAPQNITSGLQTTVSRTFAQAGDFAYSCSIHPGMNGQVLVR